ncbi:MAG: hypothetical protein ACRBCJ_04955 [Hyphomicrobiaceae bacterium]
MKPFRWTIARREQLGTLIDLDAPEGVDRHEFLPNLREASARVLGFSDGADLAFIGRTPENFFDYLSGVFSTFDGGPELHLVQFSLRWAGYEGVRAIDQRKLSAFFDYLSDEGVDAVSISRRARPLALVDFVAEGGTMMNFVTLLRLQAEQAKTDWNAVQRRLRVIALTRRTHNSPNTWRWQQHQDWLHLIPETVIKNVSVPSHFIFHLANDQAKVTQSFHPGLWDQASLHDRTISAAQRAALNFAVQLFDIGRQREERQKLAGLIAKSQEMRHPATRHLVSQIKGR